MRIISGSAKRKKLISPPNLKIRPVLDRVKTTIFDILGNIENYYILDLFAGTGSLGIEALSRGAKYVCFVDSSKISIKIIKQNLTLCRWEKKAEIIKANAINIIKGFYQKKKFNLIFIDPPYKKVKLGETCLEKIITYKILSPNGKIIFEHLTKHNLKIPNELNIFRKRKFGQTSISFLNLFLE